MAAGLGAWLYVAYRERLKQGIFLHAPVIGLVFERKEPVLAAKLDFERRGASTHSREFTLYVKARSELEAANAAAGAKPAISEIIDAENLKAAISPNGFVTIKGTGLATSSREWAGSDFKGTALPTSPWLDC